MAILNWSELKKEILDLYFSRPERQYYIRELERKIGKPASYIRRELLKMEEEGLFFSEFRGKERYFGLNKKHPLYPEIKKIVFKTIGIEASLKKILEKTEKIQSAFIFGSYASNNEDEKSDIDLMILGSPDEDRLLGNISRLELKLDREINYHIFKNSEFLKLSPKRDSFIESVLKKPKIFLIGDEKTISRFIG